MTPTPDPLPVARDYSAFDRAVAAAQRPVDNRIPHGGPAPIRRLVAFLLDPVILAMVTTVIVDVVDTAMEPTARAAWQHADDPTAPIPEVNGALFVSMLAVVPLLPVALGIVEMLTGATPAKLLLRLQVLGQDGRRPPRRRMVLRWLMKSGWWLLVLMALVLAVSGLPGSEWAMVAAFAGWVVSTIGSVPGVVGSVTLHDLVARTQVVTRP